MNSDTPETDAHQAQEGMAHDWLWRDFACKLERERNAAIAELEAWRSEKGPEGWWVKHKDYISQLEEWRDEKAALKSERDELAERLDFQEKLNRECIDQIGARTDERDDARKQLRKAQVENDHNWQAIEMYEAERALADRLALALKMTRWDSPVTCKKAFDAWKEERGLD